MVPNSLWQALQLKNFLQQRATHGGLCVESVFAKEEEWFVGRRAGRKPTRIVGKLAPAGKRYPPNFSNITNEKNTAGAEILSIKKYKRAKTRGTRFLAVA